MKAGSPLNIYPGVPLKTAGEILGQKTSTMTERYSHLTPEHTRQAVEMLPDWESAGKGDAKAAKIEKGVTA